MITPKILIVLTQNLNCNLIIETSRRELKFKNRQPVATNYFQHDIHKNINRFDTKFGLEF